MKVLIKECFKITGLGYVVEIKHNENGLPKGLNLLSEKEEIWEVKSRVIFSHFENHIFFPNETQSITLLKFTDIEKYQESIKSLLEKEKNNIFQYILHNSSNSELRKAEAMQIIEKIEK